MKKPQTWEKGLSAHYSNSLERVEFSLNALQEDIAKFVQLLFACANCQHELSNLMNNKLRKTLGAVFTDAVSGMVERAAIETPLIAAGADVIEDTGSWDRFVKDGEVETFHRPHPD